jgi:hypothetical protein
MDKKIAAPTKVVKVPKSVLKLMKGGMVTLQQACEHQMSNFNANTGSVSNYCMKQGSANGWSGF